MSIIIFKWSKLYKFLLLLRMASIHKKIHLITLELLIIFDYFGVIFLKLNMKNQNNLKNNKQNTN